MDSWADQATRVLWNRYTWETNTGDASPLPTRMCISNRADRCHVLSPLGVILVVLHLVVSCGSRTRIHCRGEASPRTPGSTKPLASCGIATDWKSVLGMLRPPLRHCPNLLVGMDGDPCRPLWHDSNTVLPTCFDMPQCRCYNARTRSEAVRNRSRSLPRESQHAK